MTSVQAISIKKVVKSTVFLLRIYLMSENKPTPIIKPTIGRRVWFRCSDSFAKEKGIYRIDDVQAMDAGIVYVHGDTMVNLNITDHIGNTHAINSVTLVDDANGNSYVMWCEWMPYQKEQVKTVKSLDTTGDNQVADGSDGECIHRSKLLDNRENSYLFTQLLNTPNINSDLRKKVETKITALLDELI